MQNTEILFIRVVDTTSKLQQLIAVVQRHYLARQPLLIAVADEQSASYVDNLLWRLPEEGFMPHAIINRHCHELIAITTSTENVNGAKILFNLLPQVHPHYAQYSIVYELYDETHPSKLELSKARLQAYPHSRILN